MIARGVLEVDSSERRTKEGVRDGDRYGGHTHMVYFDFLWMIRINRYPRSVLHFPLRFTMHSVDSELGFWPVLRAASKHWCMIVSAMSAQ
jgi:hypothetical protein